MKQVAGIRRSLGVRTLFNWVGPLANPARASHQLLGVSDPARVDVVARVLAALGAERALVVHGAGGLDELSLERGNHAVWVERGQEPRAVTVEADAIDLPAAPTQALEGGTPDENAGHVRAVLSGRPGARRDAAILNAAAALWVAGAADSLEAGAALAREALDSGAAARVLDRYVALSQEIGAG
jgi:anthranilate phosphoribosyltransferase